MKRVSSGRKILAIVGPTAVGKSALAVRLARRFHGEVISADSRQVYRGLNIGTGKITRREMCGIPHHLLDVASPRRQFTVAEFVEKGRRAIAAIARRGKLPIIVGGTGLYIDALLGAVRIPSVPQNPTLRARLADKSAGELLAMLTIADPKRGAALNPSDRHNPRRLIRALEIATATKRKHSDILKNVGMTSEPMSACWIGLTLPPEGLKKKIAIRLFARLRSANGQARMSRGMLAEVRRLHEKGLSWKRMEELGLEYRYVSRHIRGLLTKKEMIARLQSEIRHYAKRQFVWFKRNARITWFTPSEIRSIERTVCEFLSS